MAASDPLPTSLSLDAARDTVLVFGIGNTLRGDDGLGPLVAERLADTFTTGTMTVTPCHQLTFDFAQPISHSQCVILVDAAVGGVPGTIACKRVAPQGDLPHTMLHHMEPEALLASTQALYGSVPPTFLWTVVGEQFDFGETLSPVVEGAIPELIERLTAFIEDCFAD